MGPKYEFTGETKKHIISIVHRIRRLSDGKLGGWIESEENLSQEGNCWVDDDAIVYDWAKVYDNAQICNNARVHSHAKVYGNAIVSDSAEVYSNAEVYGNANVYGDARVYGAAQVYGNAQVSGHAKVYDIAEVYDNAKIYGNAEVYGDAKVYGSAHVCYRSKVYGSGKYHNNEEEDLSKEVVQDFIYKVDDSNKITTQTEYNSVDEFFSEPIKNDVKLDTLIICAVDTKEPLIKLQKVETDSKTEFKFIVDITNEDGDNFTFKSIIKSQEQLNQLVQQTIDMLKQSPQFAKYVEDLEECL